MGERAFTGTKKLALEGRHDVTGLGETATWDDGMDMRVVLELSAPGMQDTGKTREIGPDEPLVLGEPFKGCGRGVGHGLVSEAWTRADEGTQGLRNGDR